MLGTRLGFALFALVVMNPQIAPGQGTTRSADQIAALVAQYDTSWDRGDTVAVSRLLAPRYQYFTSRGDVWSREQVLKLLGSPQYALEHWERSELEVSRSGSVTVVNSRWQGRGTYEGKSFTDDQRCGQVWLKSGRAWQVLSEHCVQIAPKAPADSN